MTISIDLGVVSGERPDLGSRPPGPGTWRLVALAACLLLTTGLLGASARPVRQVLPEVRVPIGPSDGYAVEDGTLYVLGSGLITALTVPDGEQRWQRRTGTSSPSVGVAAAGDVLLAYFGVQPSDHRLVALNAGTGEPMWERAGDGPMFAGAESLLFVTDGSDTSVPTSWERVRTSTGERLSRREFPPGTWWQGTLGDEQLMMTLPGGRVEIWDTAADRMISAADLPEQLSLVPQGNVALGMTGSNTMSGYSLPGLRQIWQRQFDDLTGWVACDMTVFCIQNGADQTTGIDPATGDVLWERESRDGFLPMGPVLVADARSRSDAQGSLIVVDPRTGGTLRDFGPWQMIEYGFDGSPERMVVAQVDAAASVTLVGELDVRALTLRVIGKIHDAGVDCSAVGTVLLCRTQDNALGMWELPISR